MILTYRKHFQALIIPGRCSIMASGQHCPYFALPAEIRNQIMEYVLIPGDIYIRPAKRTRRAQRPWKSAFLRPKRFMNAVTTLSRYLLGQSQRLSTDKSQTIKQPGLQFLLTCKQAYNDGLCMFYARNTFHWPPGPLNNSHCWYANIQPQHQKMIRTICIDIDLDDLTYQNLDSLETSARRRHGRRPDDYDGNVWSDEARYQLVKRAWIKILGLHCYFSNQNLCGFVGLERLIIQSSIGRYVLGSGPGNDDNQWESVTEFICAVSHYFGIIVELHVNGRGWRKTRRWLEGGRTRLGA